MAERRDHRRLINFTLSESISRPARYRLSATTHWMELASLEPICAISRRDVTRSTLDSGLILALRGFEQLLNDDRRAGPISGDARHRSSGGPASDYGSVLQCGLARRITIRGLANAWFGCPRALKSVAVHRHSSAGTATVCAFRVNGTT